MKKMLTTILLMLIFGLAVNAYSVELDSTFESTRKWLGEQKLVLTGGSNSSRDDVAAFTQQSLVFYGEAVGNPAHQNPAQRGMMAKRAAVIVAQRALVEYLEGFTLSSSTTVKDFIAQEDKIVSVVAGTARGAQIVFQEYNKATDTAVAVIKLDMHGPSGFASSMYERINSSPKLKEAIKTDKQPFKAEPATLDEVYDGLIIDATAQKFRPALINRIFATKGEVLYDPATISQRVLVEQGCGEYANNIDKAKAALATRGVKNPLIIKASGTLSASDLQVTDDDAVTIFSANKKGSFMAAAKVAFVLK
jgi:hypothetical protein